MMIVRRAELADSGDILAWRNDPDSVRMSISQKPISPDTHDDWFLGSLDSSRCVHLVGETKDWNDSRHKVGVCRFDERRREEWSVSINVNPEHRGKHLARPLLSKSIEFFVGNRSGGPVKLIAEIRLDNLKSLAIFEKNKFEVVERSERVLLLRREFP